MIKVSTPASKLLLFALFFAWMSCASLEPARPNDRQMKLPGRDLAVFEGNYAIMSVDTSYKTLDEVLFLESPYNFKNWPGPDDRVSLRAIDDRHLEATVFDKGKVLRTKILKGKWNGDFFELKGSTKISLFWVILNGFRTGKARISMLKNGNLTVDAYGGGCILLVFFPIGCASGEEYQLEFNKL